MLSAVLSLSFSLAALPEEEAPDPCADSLLPEAEFRIHEAWEVPAREDCDLEESLLFSPRHAARRERESSRASFTWSRSPGKPAHAVLRSQARRDGWEHRLEVRGDSLARRQLAWSGRGWRLLAGDLIDTALPLWPRWFPRRTLPTGWKPARAPALEFPGSALPQGVGAGLAGPGWKAWALRAWNPVETGREPPWHDAWDLRHSAAGASAAWPWITSLHFSETRITRGERDSLAEQRIAGELSSPRGGAVLGAAWSDSRLSERPGWMLAAELRHRFAGAGTLEFTARQRGADWRSSWDPASPATSTASADAGEDIGNEDRGAGEARLAARLPWSKQRPRDGFASAEAWGAWNPQANTSRQGARGRLSWRGEGGRLELSGTHRVTRNASGSVSTYEFLQAETRTHDNPRWKASAHRAWNHRGPLRDGLFLGAEPAWRDLRLSPGLELVSKRASGPEALASLGVQWNFAPGWKLDAAGSAPLRPGPDPDAARWRLTVQHAAAAKRLR